MAWLLEKEVHNKAADQPPNINKSADQGLKIRSSVPEEPTGETDCSTYILSQDNK